VLSAHVSYDRRYHTHFPPQMDSVVFDLCRGPWHGVAQGCALAREHRTQQQTAKIAITNPVRIVYVYDI
jgi:hypothetical protein